MSFSSSPPNVEPEIMSRSNATIPPIKIIHSGMYHLIVDKPASVVCHHSGWAGLRSRKKGKGLSDNPEIPMLQRVRDTVGRRVNLVHRLDRGTSGALLFTYAESDDDSSTDELLDHSTSDHDDTTKKRIGPTAAFIQALASPEAQKTYVAIVRGEGIRYGEDFKTLGWFPVSRAIRDERGVLNEATTMVRFVAGQAEEEMNHPTSPERPRLSLVLARPVEGRWHQIRRHLNGLSHPILGDSSHGHSRLNREWRDKRGLSYERTCLHLARIQIPSADPYTSEPLDVSCPLAKDMVELLEKYAPEVFEEAKPILREEGVIWDGMELV
jgi:23S rRNA-/tRNA-specific pseudouridylate synthase